ncbi:MAG TPA: hypothetical protein VK395_18215 [Gemmataceae bacterium]|nr:hypothetical protein [Gemmataceae bacterium]
MYRRDEIAIGLFACLAALALHARAIFWPMIVFDDFGILARSLTWSTTCANLWIPANEHAMPLGRLSTWCLVQLAGRPTWFPAVCAWQGPLAFLAAMGLLCLFVRRELGHPLYGLVAMILFGVTSVHAQAVTWYSASFSVLTLDSLLLGLLAAQRWRQTRHSIYLVLCALCTALAPGWFASGVLAGPLCSLYLLPSRDAALPKSGTGPSKRRFTISAFMAMLVPLLGTLAFLAVSLPLTGERIMHAEHYSGSTAIQALGPVTGLLNTGRSIVENLTLGIFGISSVDCPPFLVPVLLIGLVWLLWKWWRPARERRLLYLGLGFILLSYMLVYSARAAWPYEGNMNRPSWGRYHLLPQVGLALLCCGALPSHLRIGGEQASSGLLSRRPAFVLCLGICALFCIQLPRGLLAGPPYEPEQMEVLRRIERVDECCRQNHIAAATARAALASLQLPLCGESDNGWELLRGSADPRVMTVEEARRLLQNCE